MYGLFGSNFISLIVGVSRRDCYIILQMMDLGKLKVVELRGELSKRGLDTKGNKPVLIERLRKALDQETGDRKFF